jgi:predicted Rossmann fold nucleotide-binding protein DprA/Smf involved in DNA uptake
MNIGLVGNRRGWTYQEIEDKLDDLGCYHSDVIITGGAEGVDEFARMYAKTKGNPCLILYPKPTLPHPNRYYQRNREIACRCDILVAFNNNKKSGTSNTIRYAKEMNKQVVEINQSK